MKTIIYFLLISSLASCMFSNHTKKIKLDNPSFEKPINFVTEDSFNIRLDRMSWISFITDTAEKNSINELLQIVKNDTIYLDSAYTLSNRATFFETENFIVRQLSEGKAGITDMKTGVPVRHLKCRHSFYRRTLFTEKKKRAVTFYSGKQEIISIRYIIIDF